MHVESGVAQGPRLGITLILIRNGDATVKEMPL